MQTYILLFSLVIMISHTTVIKKYGECCCRVQSNIKAGIFNTEVVRQNLVTVCDKFQLVQCSQSVVSYG